MTAHRLPLASHRKWAVLSVVPFAPLVIWALKRNLTSQEIVDQILAIQRESGQRVGNIVYMGQGEPLLNCKEVIKSLHLVMESVGIGARHITVSTSGIVPGIDALAREKLHQSLSLALSLHAPDTETREEIVPITTKYPIHQVMEALHNYVDTTRRRVTIEYVLLEGVNDSEAQARQLAELCRDLQYQSHPLQSHNE